jgi:DNA-directed RNA polymerase subunit RPC12/RpoP
MTTPITIAYLCPKCGAGQAILPSKIEATGLVRCAQCGRPHGRLAEVQEQLASKAREESLQTMQQIYRNRPTGKNRSF